MAAVREVKQQVDIKDYDEFIQQLIKQMGIIHNKVYKNVKGTNERMEQQVNIHRKGFQFVMYDLVMKYIGNRLQGNEKKLTNNWAGPYEIIKIMDNGVNFKIRNIKDPEEITTVNGKDLMMHEKWRRTGKDKQE